MNQDLNIARPNKPASTCVKCEQPHQEGQHRVIHNQHISLFANTTPLFNQPYGTEALKLTDGWFYLSLHVPLRPVIQTLQQGELPWLCPQCAGYDGSSNKKAPGATVLNDEGQQRATGTYELFDKLRVERELTV